MGGSGFGGGGGGIALLGFCDGNIHAAVDFAAGLTRAQGAAAEGIVVADDPICGNFQEVCIGAQEAARVDLGEADVEEIGLKFLQEVAPNFCGLGCLANGDTLFFARLFEALTDGLHGDGLGG